MRMRQNSKFSLLGSWNLQIWGITVPKNSQKMCRMYRKCAKLQTPGFRLWILYSVLKLSGVHLTYMNKTEVN